MLNISVNALLVIVCLAHMYNGTYVRLKTEHCVQAAGGA